MRCGVRILLGLLTAGLGCQPAGNRDQADAPTFDVIITGGRIVDGTGNPWFRGDLAIRAGHIVRVTPPGLLADAQATERVDASGRVVSPGFIDLDSQSQGAFTIGDGRVVSMMTQGVTTAVVGEGETIAPISPYRLKAMKSPGNAYARIADTLGARLMHPDGFARWLELMERRGISQNVAALLGAQTMRVYAKGEAEGAPTAAELDTMRAVARRAMEDGAFGVASALIYPPGNYASTEELIAAAKAVAPFGGIYASHMRSEGDRIIEAIDEALRIGREGGVPVEIYHLKVAGRRNWSKLPAVLAKIDSARAAGQDVAADMYLYTAGWTELANCAPPWAAADGKLLANLQDPAIRARIEAEMTRPDERNEGLCLLAGPEGIQFSGFSKPENKRWEGKRLAEAAAGLGKEWFDTWADFVVSDPGTSMVVHMIDEPNLPIELRQPWIKINTDANGVDPDSVGTTHYHPRSYGNYPRLLGRYVREQRVVPLEDAIRKSTSAVAARLSIRDRGVLREGAWADVVIFDPETIIDPATYEQPNQLSVGIEQVWVNGVRVVANGKHTGAKPGRALRGPGWVARRSR